MNQLFQPEKPSKRILIACVGNIFLGDDGFGVEVAQRLRYRTYPEQVQVVDFGIRGVELAYTLLDGYDELVLVDVVPRGGIPGTLYLIEPDLSGISTGQVAQASQVALDAHGMDPVKMLAFARMLGAQPIHTLIVGCEPAFIITDENPVDIHMGLSQPVQAAVDEAVKMLDSLVERLLTSAPVS